MYAKNDNIYVDYYEMGHVMLTIVMALDFELIEWFKVRGKLR